MRNNMSAMHLMFQKNYTLYKLNTKHYERFKRNKNRKEFNGSLCR